MKVHFIAMGGSVMHNLALVLKQQGNEVSGSDDAFFSPSKERLADAGLLPEPGWDAQRITSDLDAIILGMHAKKDNPELLKAQELNLKISSFPEYVYEQTKNKTRIVVGGSHGKTSTTLMIMHVLKHAGVTFDYMAGSTSDGFSQAVNFDNKSTVAVLEGDEYLSSPLDLTPKFHHYKPDIGIITGIAWDHMNVFPTYHIYVKQFEIYANSIESNGTLIAFNDHADVCKVAEKHENAILYSTPENNNKGIFIDGVFIPLIVFGEHNYQNINAAWLACKQVGISLSVFAEAISTFKGARKRLELVEQRDGVTIYSDFAHSPSKLKATVSAVRNYHHDKKIIAIYELHTFSSVNPDFLPEYNGAMDETDQAMLFFNPSVVAKKGLPNLNAELIKSHFNNSKLEVFDDIHQLFEKAKTYKTDNCVFLFMSSGTLGGIQLTHVLD